jgi:hypothetical protein
VPAGTFTNDNQISIKQTSDEITFMAKNSPNKNEIILGHRIILGTRQKVSLI